MLTGEIKIHEEPVVVHISSTGTSFYDRMTTKERAEFDEEYKETLAKAKFILQPGDRILLGAKVSRGNYKVVTGFVERPQDCITYCTDICVVYCRDEHLPAQSPIRYALSELNLESLVKLEDIPENIPPQLSLVPTDCC